MQLLAPDDYAKLELKDQWIEDILQHYEAQWLIDHTAEGERILDLGWGSGIIARSLHEKKRNITVVEGAIESCLLALDKYGIPAQNYMFEDYEPTTRFYTVIASFVLEHVENPVQLLMKAHNWADRLIVIVGNANSYHRQLAVKMGLQPALDTLSERDRQVGHYRVYTLESITNELAKAGWMCVQVAPLMLKPLPNSMLSHYDPKLIHAMCRVPVPVECAANIIIEARKF